MIISRGAFFFLFTYLIAPFAIWEWYSIGQRFMALVLVVWWIPMLCSAIKDWREHHFGYESRFSKLWFWIGLPVICLVYLIFFRKH